MERQLSCIVTGASRGIGASICKSLMDAKFDVIAVSRTAPDTKVSRFIKCDFKSESSVADLCLELKNHGSLWALVNNAGVGFADSISSVNSDDMSRLFQVNVFAAAQLAKAASASMKDGGRIVNVGSVAGLGQAERQSYSASKATIMAMTRSWALDLASQSITVNCVNPGPVSTEVFREKYPQGSEGEKRYIEATPLGRIATTSDVASLVKFLISSESRHITGQNLFVDGGMSIGRL